MADMAITNTGISNGSGLTTLTISHTIGAGNLQAVFFMFAFSGSTAGLTVTYAGISMTLVASISTLSIYRLVNPPMGTNNAVASAAGGVASRGVVVSYSGVHQTSPNDTAVTGSGSGAGSDPSVSVSSAAGKLVIDFAYGKRTSDLPQGLSVGAGQTTLFVTPGTISNSNDGAIGASYEAGAGTNTMTWTLGTTEVGTTWLQAAISINPAPDTSFFSMF